MKDQNREPTTIEDRLVCAFISAVAMACTILALSFVFFVIASKGSFAGTQMFFDIVFSKVSLYIIAGTAIAGFFLSFDRMLDLFSNLWGTNKADENASKNRLVTLVVFAIVAGLAIFLFFQ